MAKFPYKEEWDIKNCPEIKQTKADNIARRIEGEEEIPVFEPIPHNNPDILFRSLPELLEENEGDILIPTSAMSEARLHARFDWFTPIREEVFEIFNKINISRGTWDILSGDTISRKQRFEMCQDAVDLTAVAHHARSSMIAGLYLDANKLVALCDKPAPEAARILKYNLFLGNLAMIYAVAQENEDKQSAMDVPKIRKLFLEVLQNPKISLPAPKIKCPDGTEVIPSDFLHKDVKNEKKPDRWEYEPILKIHQEAFEKAKAKTAQM